MHEDTPDPARPQEDPSSPADHISDASSDVEHAAVIRRTAARRVRIEDAPDATTRRRWTEEAARRRDERIRKAGERRSKHAAERRERQRAAVVRTHLPPDLVESWDLPAARALLDAALGDARERRLVGLPPRPEVEEGGIRRILRYRAR